MLFNVSLGISMLIFFRLSMLLLGAFYKIIGKLNNGPKTFVTHECGLKYIINKSYKKHEFFKLEFKTSLKLFFRISPEKKLHRVLKIMGFNNELQTDNLAFDDHHYIESDHPSFRRALKYNKKLQEIVIELRHHGFSKIVNYGDGTVKLVNDTLTEEQLSSDVFILLKDFQDHLNQIIVMNREDDPFIKTILFFEVFYYAANFYASSIYITHTIDGGQYLLDSWDLALRGVYYGFCLLLIWIVTSFLVLRKSSRAPVYLGEVFFGMICSLLIGGGQMMVDLNQVLDKSDPVFEKALVVDKYSRTTTGKHRKTYYYLNLQFSKNEYEIPQTLSVSMDNYYNFHSGSGIEFTIRKGFFKASYISSMKPILYENKQPIDQKMTEEDMLNLVRWEPEMFIASEENDKNTEWHEEYYENTKQLRQREPFVAGERHGVGEYWHRNGNIYAKIPWFKNQKNGLFRLYRNDGTLDQALSYKMGRPHGLSTWYNPDGKINTRVIYQEGKVVEQNMDVIESILKKRK